MGFFIFFCLRAFTFICLNALSAIFVFRFIQNFPGFLHFYVLSSFTSLLCFTALKDRIFFLLIFGNFLRIILGVSSKGGIFRKLYCPFCIFLGECTAVYGGRLVMGFVPLFRLKRQLIRLQTRRCLFIICLGRSFVV